MIVNAKKFGQMVFANATYLTINAKMSFFAFLVFTIYIQTS